MNLSPDWCRVLREQGWEAAHWLDIGSRTAPDRDVMAVATRDRYVVFTHDLDFSAMLAATQANGPSIIQVRAQDTLSAQFQDLAVGALRRFESELDSGAIVVLEQSRARVRLLPLRR